MPHSTRRYVVLASAVVVALASGSNYVYSGYAPQLGKRLNISSTQINLIGMAGNLGVYSSGPVWGKMIDTRGPTLPLIIAGCMQFLGYFVIRMFYNGFSAGSTHLDVAFTALFMCITGFGGCAGLGAAVNTVAKSFPDATRATATGVTLAGFGLSAFLFSTISHSLFPGDVSSFLLLLALGTSLPMILGSLVVKPVRTTSLFDEPSAPRISGLGEYQPITAHADEEDFPQEDEDLEVGRGGGGRHGDASIPEVHVRTPSPPLAVSRDELLVGHDTAQQTYVTPSSHEMTLTRSNSREDDAINDAAALDVKAVMLGSTVRSSSVATAKTLGPEHVDIYGKHLFATWDFWIIAGILTMLSGTGLMYINNVGSVVLALANKGAPIDFDPIAVSKYQAAQVSIISIWNCLGRVAMGFASDYAKTRFRIRRIWFCCVTSFVFVISQIAAQKASTVGRLWHVSAAVGFAYGNVFGLLPVVTMEFWGLPHFAQNWGFLSISPALGGNAANLLFGRVYDSNVVAGVPGFSPISSSSELSIRGGSIPDPSDHSHDCLIGQACYGTAFKMTTVGCCLAFVLSLVVSVRRERQSRQRRRQARLEAKWSRHAEGLEGET